MKKNFVIALCLLLAVNSLSGLVFAQKMQARKRPVVSEPTGRSSSVMGEIRASTDGVNGTVIDWHTTYELGNLGFNVYRGDADGTRRQVNDSLIVGSLVRFGEKREMAGGDLYSAYDPAGRADAVYYVETVSKYGEKALYGPVAPVYFPNLTTRSGYDARLRPDFTGSNNAIIEKNNPGSYKAGSPSMELSPVDPVNQRWVAAQPGVKIRVNKNGLYRISRAELQTAGFNVASPHANWQLYLYGVEQKIIVEPAGNYIEFYGRGLDIQNIDSQIYYLVTGPGAGQRMASTFRRPFSPNIGSVHFRNTTHYEPRSSYVYSQIVNGDGDNWFGPIISSSSISRTINIKDINTDRQKAYVEVVLHGLQNGVHSVKITLNGTDLGTVDFDGVVPASKTFTVNASLFQEGGNTFDFVGTGSLVDNTLLDYINIDYPRYYKADQNTLAFDTQNVHSTTVTGFNTPNVRVFDLFYPDDPMLILNTTTAPGAGGFDVLIPSGRAHPMLAVNENSLLSPVSITLNTPSNVSSVNSTADMLIISHGNFMAEANNWANYRRGQGLTVDVMNAEDVFDEFDYGLPTPTAVKNCLQYFKNTDPNFKYVLLIGDATYDPRNYLGTGFNDLIPTKFVNTSFGEAPSDESLGDFDNDAVAEMSIGRLPVRTPAEVTLILGKVTAFESVVQTSLSSRGVLFVADALRGWDFANTNRLLRAELPAPTPVAFIDFLETSDIPTIRNQIVDDINANNGRFIINYAGHGSIRVWSTSQIFRQVVVPQPPPPNPPILSEVQRLTNSGNKTSLFLMLTCLNGYFTDLSQDNLAEALVKAPNGGAPTSWASTGETTANIQETMATRFFHIVGLGTHQRLGDAIRESKQNAPDPDVPRTWALIGDPALKIK